MAVVAPALPTKRAEVDNPPMAKARAAMRPMGSRWVVSGFRVISSIILVSSWSLVWVYVEYRPRDWYTTNEFDVLV